MTLEACYNEMGSDLKTAVSHMGGSEKMLAKFVRKFPNDATALGLFDAFEKQDWQTAFRMAHTLKGLCMNLGLDKLQKSSAELTEALRDAVADNAPQLLEQVRADYNMTVGVLKDLDE